MWRDLSRLVDIECKIMVCSLTQTFIQGEVDIPHSGLCDKKLLLVENRNHVWRDLFRLVDIECKIMVCSLTQSFYQAEIVGLCDMKLLLWRTETIEGSLQVS